MNVSISAPNRNKKELINISRYYACLCGHHEVVSYLLENGARCDASTFDGERCIYGALNDEIRKTLQKYSVITSRVKRREQFQEFLRR